MAAPPTQPHGSQLFDRGSWPEASRIADILRTETVGGVLLVGAAVIALVWANSPWRDGYTALSGFTVGPAALHLDLLAGHLGGRRPARDLLLRRWAGAQTRVRRR